MYMELLELLADFFPATVPMMAVFGLIAAQTAHIESLRKIAISVFYGALVVVALVPFAACSPMKGLGCCTLPRLVF